MLPGLEALACPELAVSMDVMAHVVNVESSRNPYAIGVVGGRLARQPKALDEAVATARMLEENGYNFSLGLAQVNRYNLQKYGLETYEKAFQQCPNLQAGSRILAECHSRSKGDWGKAFSCYYSGNFETGYRHGYVQKVFNSMQRGQMVASANGALPIPVVDRTPRTPTAAARAPAESADAARLRTRIEGLQTQMLAQGGGVVMPLPDDPARAYVVYPNTGAMVRGSLLRAADGGLARAVTNLVDRAVPSAAPMAGYADEGYPQGHPVVSAPPMGPQQAPAGSPGAPVLLRPWSERNQPAATGAVAMPASAAPVTDAPARDAAFVF